MTANTSTTTVNSPTLTANNALIHRVMKRAMDLMGSLVGLTLLLLPLTLVALAIKLDSRGPVFFRQKRAGRNGEEFNILKFRTMVPNADRLGLRFEVSQGDNRITRLGGLLRDLGIDELPQLYNVFRGQMSLVGPRAARMDQIVNFTEAEQGRMLVKPGLSGWAQVNGRNSITWKERIQLDLWYVAHESIWLDVKIMFKTLWVVYIARSGRYGPGGVTRDYGA